jgi:hypothetical protein
MNNWGYREIWAVDFEFVGKSGERPTPVCCCARELLSGRRLRIWQDELQAIRQPPYNIDEQSLFVAYYASAEFSCHLALDWPLPVNVLDLYVEFRALNNGRPVPCGWGLIGALVYYGLDTLAGSEKETMRQLIMSGGPWSSDERSAILDYCETDILALARLLPKMGPTIDLPRALIRGRYMGAVARMEHRGIPVDAEMLETLRRHWPDIQSGIIAEINREFQVFEGTTFRHELFAAYLNRHAIPWSRLASGRLDLKDETFRTMARAYPQLQPLREARTSLSQLRLMDLAVGHDCRNRTLLSPFRSKTGRNQPSTSRFIFGPSVWLRSLIKPEPGNALAYIDWSHQEFGIAAALSGDQAMLNAYRSGDPYMAFAVRVGAAPPGATKASYRHIRERYKQVVLATQYGMGAALLAIQCDCSEFDARRMLDEHRRIFAEYWRWIEGAVNHLNLYGKIWTVFGWPLHVHDTNPRTAQNFPMQANGAEMLRLACIYLTEADIRVCAPIHDALLIEASINSIKDVVHNAQNLMARASRDVLDGFELRTDVDVFRYPNRFEDVRGKKMWRTITTLLANNAQLDRCSVLEHVGSSASEQGVV